MSTPSNSRGRKKLCDLSIDSLVRHLKKRGLDSSGPKNVLQARLVIALKRERGLLDNNNSMPPSTTQSGFQVEAESPRDNNPKISEKEGNSAEEQREEEEEGFLKEDESPTFIINAENSDQDTSLVYSSQDHQAIVEESMEMKYSAPSAAPERRELHRSHDSKESRDEEEGEFSSKESVLSGRGHKEKESKRRSTRAKDSSRSISTESRGSSRRSEVSRSRRRTRSPEKTHSSSKSYSSASSGRHERNKSPEERPSRRETHDRYRDHVHRYVASKQNRSRDHHQQRAERYEHRRSFYPPPREFRTHGQVEDLQDENRRLKLEREKLAREKEELLRREYERQRADRELIEKEKEELRRSKQQLEEEQRKLLLSQQKQPQIIETVTVQESPKTPPIQVQARSFIQRRPGFGKNQSFQQRPQFSPPQRRQDFNRNDRSQNQRISRNHDRSPQKGFFRNGWKDNRREGNDRRDTFERQSYSQKVRRTTVESPDMEDHRGSDRESRKYSPYKRQRGSSQSNFDGGSTSRTVTIVKGYGNSQDYSAYHKYDYPIVE